MNENIVTFTPNSSDQLYLWVGLLIAVVAFGVSYFLLRRPAKGRSHTGQALLAMLFFFGGLLSVSTAFFSGWNLRKQGEVSLLANELKVGTNLIPYANIKELYLRQDKGSAAFGMPSKEEATLILMVEKKDGKTIAISSQQFPINEVYGRLKEILEKK